MNTPKVKFTNMPVPQEIDWMYGFLFGNDWDWGNKYIVKVHPEIKKIFSLKNEDEQIKFLKKFIANYKKENKILIEKNVVAYQEEWRKVEKDFFILLSDILQIEWPQNRKVIRALVSVNPICSRFLAEWSFSIFCNNKKISHAIETIMHEACHFLYFEKWKKHYPKMSHKKFESPYIEWHLSEIIAPIILNDKRVQKLLKQKAFFYGEHESAMIRKKSAPQYFTELYLESEGFDEFLNNAYMKIKKNKVIFTRAG